MESRRHTLFPIPDDTRKYSGDTSTPDRIQVVKRRVPSPHEDSTPKRRFDKNTKPLELELLKPADVARPVEPVQADPGQFYQSIFIANPADKRSYCLAQEKSVNKGDRNSYRIVTVVKKPRQSTMLNLARPHPNVLNVIQVFAFDEWYFIIFDRCGEPLSHIALSPRMDKEAMRTIINEALRGICALDSAGFLLDSLHEDDITVSASDGRVKVAFDPTSCRGSAESASGTQFADVLTKTMGNKHDEDVDDFIRCATNMTYQRLQDHKFLKQALPARSLACVATVAQVSTFPIEYATGVPIRDM